MNRIITIGREFGSGGRELGRRLSEILEIPYYDQEIIAEISKSTSLPEQYVQRVMEHRPIASFPIHIGRSFYPVENPIMQQGIEIYQEQSRIIREMAEKSDCLFVGRCADYILKDMNPFRIFVYASMNSKKKRCRDNARADEKLTDKELEKKIIGIDKNRSKYYEFYTDHTWGDRLNYDLCVNTTKMDIKEMAQAVANLLS